MLRLHGAFKTLDIARSWTRWVQVRPPPAQWRWPQPAPVFDVCISQLEDYDVTEDDELDL
jgi:hypothetical protein